MFFTTSIIALLCSAALGAADHMPGMLPPTVVTVTVTTTLDPSHHATPTGHGKAEAECPAVLGDGPSSYEFPHYISWVSSRSPNTTYGPQYSSTVTPKDMATVFTFDIPDARAADDSMCKLQFMFPKMNQLRFGSFTLDGPGTFQFSRFKPGNCIGTRSQTSWRSLPPQATEEEDGLKRLAPVTMHPGHAYTLDEVPCSELAGSCLSGMMESTDSYFDFFQSSDTCPIGLYITYS